MSKVQVVGVGLGFEDLTEKQLELVVGADVLVGGRRQLAWFPDFDGIKREISSPLSGVISDVRKWAEDRKVVVLASGDPLFFGIGSALVKGLGARNVEISPNVSTMAACFARIKTVWNGAAVVSLHGRKNWRELKRALRSPAPVFVLTSPENHPGRIGEFVEASGLPDRDMWVFEQLGNPEERVRRMSPAEAAGKTFEQPNAVVLTKKRPEPASRVPLPGAPDHWYEHERGLITKAEIRAVALSKLRIGPEHVVWDLGAGSGAVSVEASVFAPRGRVVAVEKNAERIKQILTNAETFGVENILAVRADLPEGLEDLPAPDRVFVGGGGGDLAAIVEGAAKRLSPEGRIVVNTVLIETLAAALGELKRLGFETEVVQVQIGEGVPMPSGTRFDAKNPVWIVAASRPPGGGGISIPEREARRVS